MAYRFNTMITDPINIDLVHPITRVMDDWDFEEVELEVLWGMNLNVSGDHFEVMLNVNSIKLQTTVFNIGAQKYRTFTDHITDLSNWEVNLDNLTSKGLSDTIQIESIDIDFVTMKMALA